MVDVGFTKATSQNLPKVDFDMFLKYIYENPCYNVVESSGVKMNRSSRFDYSDHAIGYVQVKRGKNKCFVKAKICPEHKIRGKLYMLTVTVNEVKQEIEDAHCLSCAAAQGGCKHVAALLKWLNRRTEEPACTSVEAYWVKPKLARSYAPFIIWD
ncbi:uncharacterized protein LOC141536859 isoform X2 [Cotesia typhae]|uniref:uncharacterized protein LOC141536859 isoform X2 n=1 Tax=Cotesia typhae TaxID=2053667 RepID=UPI003D6853F7